MISRFQIEYDARSGRYEVKEHREFTYVTISKHQTKHEAIQGRPPVHPVAGCLMIKEKDRATCQIEVYRRDAARERFCAHSICRGPDRELGGEGSARGARPRR
jgi:hypothetical protein